MTLFVWLLGILFLELQASLVLWGGLWTLFFLSLGSSCVRNVVQCHETHCAVTGPGWTMLGMVALLVDLSVIPLTQGWGIVWLAFVLVALVGSSIQWLVKQRTGRENLGESKTT